MLIGKSKHNIDAKGRVIIPGKFRTDLGSSFIITRGLDPCLYIYSLKEWDTLEKKIRELPMGKSRDVQRFFFANAEEVQLDSQGRILIPQHLREYAGLEKEVYVIGNSVRAEVWSVESWSRAESEDTGEEIVKQMLELGF